MTITVESKTAAGKALEQQLRPRTLKHNCRSEIGNGRTF